MRKVEVPLGERSYEVLIGDGLLDRAGELLAPYGRGGRQIVVADEGAWAAQGERLKEAALGMELITIPPGEASKSWSGLESLVEKLLALGVERGDHIVAFGGGMVGDLAGFAASILKRGCGVVQIPTTLLAQVDSSVGGKTAINAAAGKNLIGAFHQPAVVLIDPSTLDTLAVRQLRAGYAETVKYGLIGDPGFFAWCESNGAALLAGDGDARAFAIETCVRAKAAIVAADERESGGKRALLNFGHTFGHALEAEAGYSDALLHGEAVSIGMALAFRFSVERGLCPAADSERVDAHLAAVGLPVKARIAEVRSFAALMASDKKRIAGQMVFVLTRGIGKAFVDKSVELAEVEDFLRRQPG